MYISAVNTINNNTNFIKLSLEDLYIYNQEPKKVKIQRQIISVGQYISNTKVSIAILDNNTLTATINKVS